MIAPSLFTYRNFRTPQAEVLEPNVLLFDRLKDRPGQYYPQSAEMHSRTETIPGLHHGGDRLAFTGQVR